VRFPYLYLSLYPYSYGSKEYKIHVSHACLVISVENFIEDHFHDDEFAGIGDRYLSIAGCVPIFSSGRLKHYFYGLTAHFGEWVVVDGAQKLVWLIVSLFQYAQVIKHQRVFRLVGVEHRMLWGSWVSHSAPGHCTGKS
jgi:hypothetical protein